MGILDDAIREHLELKRQHGADESEVEGLEAEAFGPADRPDATDPVADSPPADPPLYESEAMTQVISPGSALTVPAGEGDQLDKVFEAKREEQATAEQQASKSEPSVADEEPRVEEHSVPAEVVEAPEAGTTAAEPEEAGAHDDGEGDAGDALEAERQHLAGQPTEHYDVDAAIAEEDEIDLLSESRLADELDRALDGPADEPDFPPVLERKPEAEAPAAPEPEPEPEAPPEPADVEPSAVEGEEGTPPPVATGEAVEEEEHDLAEGEFFDQDDPLEGTPDFLEETPEHDRLWFEQKEPKDFDFGD
jgi:hypothetical protein